MRGWEEGVRGLKRVRAGAGSRVAGENRDTGCGWGRGKKIIQKKAEMTVK